MCKATIVSSEKNKGITLQFLQRCKLNVLSCRNVCELCVNLCERMSTRVRLIFNICVTISQDLSALRGCCVCHHFSCILKASRYIQKQSQPEIRRLGARNFACLLTKPIDNYSSAPSG